MNCSGVLNRFVRDVVPSRYRQRNCIYFFPTLLREKRSINVDSFDSGAVSRRLKIAKGAIP